MQRAIFSGACTYTFSIIEDAPLYEAQLRVSTAPRGPDIYSFTRFYDAHDPRAMLEEFFTDRPLAYGQPVYMSNKVLDSLLGELDKA